MALRDEDDELYVVESCADGVMKTHWDVYSANMRKAEKEWFLVWVPLSAESRAKWNNTAALEFFR